MKSEKSIKTRVLLSILAVLVVAIVVVRVYLSSWLLDYVNNVLSHINGYQGSVESINIDLYRGAYRINKLVLNKKDGSIPTPFISIETTDLSLQWSALLHGRVVSSAVLIKPVINFAVSKSSSQSGTEADWTKPIKDLMPIDINSVKFKDGSITYQDFSSTPKVDVYLHKMNGEIQNLRNVVSNSKALPSVVDVAGNTIGGGTLKLHGRMNILKQIPDMDLLMAMENVDLPALNNFSDAYAAFDFKGGTFSLYSQLGVNNGAVTGYVKPILTHLSVEILKKANPVQIAWDATVATVLKIFTNPTKDQFATRVDLEGNLGNINTNVWSTLGGILRNAFVSAMTKGFDETGNQDATKPAE
jgi:hypothetical protein